MTNAFKTNAQLPSSGSQATLGETTRKYDPTEVNFRRLQGVPNFRCGDCAFYENGTCRIVAVSDIDPNDICDRFEALTLGNLPSFEASRPRQAGTPVTERAMMIQGPLRRVIPAFALTEMFITRVSEDRQTGVKHWFSSASGLERDLYDERMSVDLFRDFIKRAESRDEVPAPFSSKAWNGGLPYLGVAHYLDLDGAGIVGPTEQVYVDGNVFKARGSFNDSPIGTASYTAIKNDIEKNVPSDQRTRVSIAFIDWLHDHEGHGSFERKSMIERCAMCEKGLGEKIYRAGHLVHLALTRRPAYPKAEIGLEE